MADYFEVFGLPRKLQIDLDALQRSFYELSRRHHPDFHQGAGAEDQAEFDRAEAGVAERPSPSRLRRIGRRALPERFLSLWHHI
jgi:DnaJ-domain-containing protein 1